MRRLRAAERSIAHENHPHVPQHLSLDRLLQPQFVVYGRSISAFQCCGLIGLSLAIGLTCSLVVHRGLSLLVALWIILLFPVTFWLLAMLTKIVSGVEILVYYRHMLLFLASATLLLGLLGEPQLPYLDIAALGIGVFIACGRIGCLLTGCCHGQPHDWGIRYGPAHVANGFNRQLVGVRLLPTQLIESIGVAGITMIGLAVLLMQQSPGIAFVWYLVAYALMRFVLEFWRADHGRSYVRGFSEAQWTSLALLIGIAIAGVTGWLPLAWWQIAAASLVLLLVCVDLWRDGPTQRWLREPTQISELAAALDTIRSQASHSVSIAATSAGLRISVSSSEHDGQIMQHYALSRPALSLTPAMASALAKLIVQLRHPGSTHQLISGSPGVFHVRIPLAHEHHLLFHYGDPAKQCQPTSAKPFL